MHYFGVRTIVVACMKVLNILNFKVMSLNLAMIVPVPCLSLSISVQSVCVY